MPEVVYSFERVSCKAKCHCSKKQRQQGQQSYIAGQQLPTADSLHHAAVGSSKTGSTRIRAVSLQLQSQVLSQLQVTRESAPESLLRAIRACFVLLLSHITVVACGKCLLT